MSQPRIGIVYGCFNASQYIEECLKSIETQDYPADLITTFVFTAGDQAAKAIFDQVKAQKKSDPDRLIYLELENRGFAANNNRGIEAAINAGCDYVFLQNGDLKLSPKTISELVKLMESDPKIGSAQSLILYWPEPQKINVSGGVIHVAGYGFSRDNGSLLSGHHFKSGEEIGYSSGASVMFRVSALQEVGLLEEGFFMYHEDLELGLRLFIAGWKNVLCPSSLSFHDYHFSANPKKFAWMELYRYLVLFSYLKLQSILVLSPLLLAIELGSIPLALRGGWIKAKLWSYRQWFDPATWRLVFKIRTRAQNLRKRSDREVVSLMTGKIEAQEMSSPIMESLINPTVDRVFRFLKVFI